MDWINKKLFNVKQAWIKLQRDTKAFNYKYATLDQIQSKLWDILEKEKLLIIHRIMNNKVITEIRDIETDVFISSEIEMSEWIKAQDKGSEITYFRRYNLLCLLDLEVEDDDGKKAQESKNETTQDKVWLNYNNFKDIVDAGNTTEEAIRRVITEDGYAVSKQAGIAIASYCKTWIIDKNLFFKK